MIMPRRGAYTKLGNKTSPIFHSPLSYKVPVRQKHKEARIPCGTQELTVSRVSGTELEQGRLRLSSEGIRVTLSSVDWDGQYDD